MLQDATLAYLHFAATFLLLWFLAREWTLLGAGPVALDLRRLAFADAGYGVAALGVLATGVGRMSFGARPVAFYLGNPLFHVKIGLFVLVGLVSIAPTVRLLRWRRAAKADAGFHPTAAEWRRVRRWVMIELHLIALIPLFAVLMARAIGFRG